MPKIKFENCKIDVVTKVLTDVLAMLPSSGRISVLNWPWILTHRQQAFSIRCLVLVGVQHQGQMMMHQLLIW